MDPVLVRSIDAAERLLRRHADGAWGGNTRFWPAPLADVPVDWLVLAWLVGRGGRAVPGLRYLNADPRARVVALVGAGDHDAVVAFLTEHVQDSRVLFDVSSYSNGALVERLLDHAVARGLRALYADGRMMAQTRRSDVLLDLFVHPRFDTASGAIGETVIRGRDAGAPNVRAEALWSSLAIPPWYFGMGRSVPFQDAVVRLAARSDVDQALALLDVWEGPGFRTGFRDAPEAAIARLVRSDPARAVAFVAERPTLRRRLAWSRHLLRWSVMPDAAVAFFESLLARGDHHVDLALAGSFATLDDPRWLDRAWTGVTRKRPLAIAVTFASALRRLRDRGHADRAEAIRDRLVPLLTAGVAERATDPVDVLDAFSAPDLPTGTPFGHELP